MTTLNKALIGALVVQIILAVFVLTRSDSATIGKRVKLVAGFESDKVSRIEIFKEPIDGKDGDIAVELYKKDGSWAVENAFDYPADSSKITDLLSKIAALESRGPVATSIARQTQLAVADNEYKRKVVVHGSGDPVTLYVGNPAGSRKNAVRLAGQSDIHGVTNFSTASIYASVSSWVDLEYFQVTETDVAAVSLINAQGSFDLERDGAGWKLAGDSAPTSPTGTTPGPSGQPATPAAGQPAESTDSIDNEAVGAMVKKLASIRMAEPADPGLTLSEPLATAVVRMKAPEPPGDADAGAPALSVAPEEYKFEIGPGEDGRYYLRLVGDSRAAWVYTSNLDAVVEFSEDKLYGRDKAKDDSNGDTGEVPPEVRQQLEGNLDEILRKAGQQNK